MIPIMSDNLFLLLEGLPFRRLTFASNAVLFSRGDKVRHMYLIEEGGVQLLRHGVEGRTILLQKAVDRELVAEASLYADFYHCDGVADRPSKIRVLSRASVRRQLAKGGDLAEAWIKRLSGEVQRARMRAEIFTLRTVAQRLDAWLLLNDGRLPEKGAWRTLAKELGVSPEALYRELSGRRTNFKPKP